MEHDSFDYLIIMTHLKKSGQIEGTWAVNVIMDGISIRY